MAMADPIDEPLEEFTPTREHEYQDSHYHDEEPEIVNDEMGFGGVKVPQQKKNRRPPPRPRHYDED
jgi:hypothetical protein